MAFMCSCNEYLLSVYYIDICMCHGLTKATTILVCPGLRDSAGLKTFNAQTGTVPRKLGPWVPLDKVEASVLMEGKGEQEESNPGHHHQF